MEVLKPLGEARSRSSADLMMYAAIAGRVPTVDPTPPPAARPGSLRWLATHCRQASHATCHSLRRAMSKFGDMDMLSISPGDVGQWLVREARHVGGIAHRSIQAGKQRFHRVH
jgi:hypothetical protein